MYTHQPMAGSLLTAVSPIMANVYLHYVLDLWFHKKWRARTARGNTIMVRYADDFVVGFEYQRDAERFVHDLKERMASFSLELHPDKTRLIEFGRFAKKNRRARGERRRRMHHNPYEVAKWLGKILNGWLRYYAVPTSSPSLKRFAFRLWRMWLRVLRRRSQKDRTKLDKLGRVAAAFWAPVKILHPWPEQRFAVTHLR